MNWLADTVYQERSDRFVGRQAELQAFRKWVADEKPATQVWDVSGIAGMGKSSLLWEWMAMAREQEIPLVWMDGRSCPKQPTLFLNYLHDAMESAMPAAVSATGAWPERFIWIIDNFSDLETIETWLREDLISRVPAHGGLLVCSSRRGLDRLWYVHPVWSQRVKSFALNSLSCQDVQSYFMRMGVGDSQELTEIIHKLHGYPLGIAVVGDYFSTRGKVKEAWDMSLLEAVTAELLREVTDPSLHPLLDILTVIPVADQETLQALTDPVEVTPSQYLSLSRLSFVRAVQGGIALHDVVRSQLFNYMQEYNPTGLKRLRIKAVGYLGRLYRQADSFRERSHYAFQLMEISAAAMPRESRYADVGALSAIIRDRHVEPSDVEAMHRMIESWGRQSLELASPEQAHLLLDAVVAQYPGTIRMLRAADGAPVGFFASLPLHRRTVDLLESYAPETMARYFPGEQFPEDSEKADTYFGALVGVDQGHPQYHARDLLGIIIRDGLSFLGSGLRGVVGIGDPALKELLLLLGFESHPLGMDSAVEAFVLDMRHRDFLIWVGSVVRTFNRPQPRSRYALDEDTLRRALKDFHNRTGFEQTQLPQILGCTVQEAQRILSVLLTEDAVPPLSMQEQRVLRMTYMERAGNADRLAMALHLSRPTYYRMLRQSVSNLCKVLQSGDFLSVLIDMGE